MDDFPFDPVLEDALRKLPAPSPRPEARERTLALCRAASTQRIQARRRGWQRSYLGAATLMVLLLLLDTAVDRRDKVRVSQILYGDPSPSSRAARPSALLAFRARNADIASLLRDPQSP